MRIDLARLEENLAAKADDLRVLADYNDRVERLSWQLSDMLGRMDRVPAAHCRWRMFC